MTASAGDSTDARPRLRRSQRERTSWLQVRGVIMSRIAEGIYPPGELIPTVTEALNSDSVRPMTDPVTVLAASIVPYSVTAELILYPGPDGMAVMDAAHAALTEYATAMHSIGYDVSISGIYQALHRPGVQHVVLTGPVANVEVGAGQAPYCTAINLTMREPDA